MTVLRSVMTVTSLALLLPQVARAQSSTRSFDDLPATLKMGQTLTTTIGALAGFAIEGVQRVEHVRYWAPAKTVSFAPVFSPSRKGLVVVFRF